MLIHIVIDMSVLKTWIIFISSIIQEALEKVDESAKVETLSVTQKKRFFYSHFSFYSLRKETFRCHLDKQPNEEEITEANML